MRCGSMRSSRRSTRTSTRCRRAPRRGAASRGDLGAPWPLDWHHGKQGAVAAQRPGCRHVSWSQHPPSKNAAKVRGFGRVR
eukprot:gene17802-biopygen18911